MRHHRTMAKPVVILTVLALLIAACGTEGGDTTTSGATNQCGDN